MFHPLSMRPGELFAGEFRIEAPLATGGMGAVYVAEQQSTGRKRALKLMHPSLVRNPRTRERFEQEARVGSRITSDHVVEVVAAGIDSGSGSPWLAMELLEGETLTARVERAGAMRPAEVLEVFQQLCHALAAAHAIGVVHRDIKPDNLFLANPRREGIPFTLKILDFGIAKLNEDVRSSGGVTGAVGSPMWMAPEQTSSTAVTPATDVWALGLVAFYCLTGHSYWHSASASDGTLQGLLKEVCIDPLVPATTRTSAALPAGFDAWFARAVVREPERRFADASQALAALRPVLLSGPGVSTAVATSVPPHVPASSGSKSWRWLVAIAAVIVLGGIAMVGVVGVAFGFWFSSVRSDDRAASPSPLPRATVATAPTASNTAQEEAAGATPEPSTREKAQPLPTAPPTATAAAQGEPAETKLDPVAQQKKEDEADGPKREYNLPWYRSKITQCWKGNEGAKPDAGAYSCSITFSINEIGQTSSIVVSPRPHKHFAGCAVVRTSEHPWGKGPKETKTYTFNF